ncbi:DUF6527 family protein [Hydrogenophaga sp. OTU3427]|uniref:DUF6527 family protein n=1 Tax=Hydrogenophaga sp. OTU3427 TaxID=3043856 RepID=UPI00313B642D
MKFVQMLRRAWDRYGPARRMVIIEGDTLPQRLPRRDLVLAREAGENICVGMRCPCGCGRSIQLAAFDVARPRWGVTADRDGRPSLYPSVDVKKGCRSHFWVSHGRIIWCD